ncbi:MAG: hypothetical protein PHU85_16675 [Phycisphaerae bacterium]|nr:hypothetical protein [Phycisphaerae bacterium]
MQREFFFDTDLPWWLFAAGALLAIALIGKLYRFERHEAGRIRGPILTALRMILVALVLLMLGQPVLRTWHTIVQQRQVAVLVDDSASMRIPDAQASPAERLRWADAVGLLAHDIRPVRLELLAAQLSVLSQTADRLTGQVGELRLYRGRGTPVPETLTDTLDATGATLAAAAEQLARQGKPLGEQEAFRAFLPPPAQAQWIKLAVAMKDEATPAVEELVKRTTTYKKKWVKVEDKDLLALVDHLAKTGKGCRATAALVVQPLAASPAASLGALVDDETAKRLDAESRRALDEMSRTPRETLVRQLLAKQGGNLLAEAGRSTAGGRKDDRFAISLYRFGRTCSALPESVIEQTTASKQPPANGSLDRGEDATDPAAAVGQILMRGDGGSESAGLAGILMLTDGRFNGAGDPAAAARQRRVPIVPVTIGSKLPPVDLAVMKLQTPDSLFKDDTANITALVKMDGLTGRDVEVQLFEAGSGTPVQTRRLRANAISERRQVEFALKPEHTGPANYEVRARIAGENPPTDVMLSNDALPFTVMVTDEPTKVLIVDGPPRWESRYIINLLLRDKGILLQHMYFQPAYIQPQSPAAAPAAQPQPASPPTPAKPPRYANVKEAKEKGIAEVDALPKTVEELFAFDVVILGDVSPVDLPEQTQRDLERFVSERGGTLIVIAGKEHMPARYEKLPLAGLLPVKLSPLDALTSRASLVPFHVKLTDAGLRSDVMRLSMELADSQLAWDRAPLSTWRCAIATAKPSATVFAYAEPIGEKSDVAKPDPATPAPAEESAASEAAKREEIARQRPLILSQSYGLGQVMFLAWDRTWQLRYKVGDKYHHKLWAQMMRWATAGRLPGGSQHVKLGTERATYRPGEEITIRAKVTRDDFTPARGGELVAKIMRAGKVERQVNLLPAWLGATSQPAGEAVTTQPDAEKRNPSEGVFVARTAPLPGGLYTIVLEAKRVPGLADDQLSQKVAIDLFVAASDPIELQELAARPATELAEGGLVLEPSTAALVSQLFGQPVLRTRLHSDLSLWSSWWLLLVFAAVASLEWIMRKRAGLI